MVCIAISDAAWASFLHCGCFVGLEVERRRFAVAFSSLISSLCRVCRSGFSQGQGCPVVLNPVAVGIVGPNAAEKPESIEW